MKTVKGDLIKMSLDGYFDILVHGCNCFGSMGAGIAKQIAEQWPGVLYVDQLTNYGDQSKLGSYSKYYDEDNKITIINMYTQYSVGKGCQVNYDAVKFGFQTLNDMYKTFSSVRIGIPKIGAGLGGGDWNKIKQIIVDACPDIIDRMTLVEYIS